MALYFEFSTYLINKNCTPSYFFFLAILPTGLERNHCADSHENNDFDTTKASVFRPKRLLCKIVLRS